MRLMATIDYWDGRPGKIADILPERITSFAMFFTDKNVASVTITRPPDLVRLAQEDNDNV